MKKILLAIVLIIGVISCTKESIEEKQAVCHTVFHKDYKNPPSDTTLANRTYWLWMVIDPNAYLIPGNVYELQVPKYIWDTMLVVRYPDIYCY